MRERRHPARVVLCTLIATLATGGAVIAHYSDDDDEQNETYRLVARVLRWETGRMTATAYALSGGLALTPTIEVGVRQDGGNAEQEPASTPAPGSC